MIDTHAHIDAEVFDSDRDEILQRAFNSGVESIIVPAVEPSNFKKVTELAASYKQIYCAIGIHPHSASIASPSSLLDVEMLSHNPKVVGIGEIGLDYHYDFSPREIQKDVFRKQLQIAKRRKLPVIIHNRESDTDMLSILEDEKDESLNGVAHCFSGDMDFLNRILNLGFYVSFTGNITFKNTHLESIVESVPNDRFMLETDSPYMAPIPNRGKRNEPSFVRLVAQKIAEIKSISIDEVLSMTTENAKKFFKISITVILFFFFFSWMYTPAKADDNQDEDTTISQPLSPLRQSYSKYIGFGPTLGVLTIVQTYYGAGINTPNLDVSYEGVLFAGASFDYGVFDFLLAELSYSYAKNSKIAQYDNGGQLVIGPDIHQIIDITTKWIANPYSRVNFFASIGPSLFINTISQGVSPGDGKVPENHSNVIGLNGGIGFMINIPISKVGLFTINGEWRLDFDLSKHTSYITDGTDPVTQQPIIKQHDLTAFYSMPRLNVIWYPWFLKR